jgi:hypothetical protein
VELGVGLGLSLEETGPGLAWLERCKVLWHVAIEVFVLEVWDMEGGVRRAGPGHPWP